MPAYKRFHGNLYFWIEGKPILVEIMSELQMTTYLRIRSSLAGVLPGGLSCSS